MNDNLEVLGDGREASSGAASDTASGHGRSHCRSVVHGGLVMSFVIGMAV